MEPPPPPDPRIDFLGNCVQKTMKLKPEKWSRLMGQEDYKNIVLDFLDTDKTSLLVITQNNAAQLIPSTSFPVLLKNKGAYFVKKNRGAIPKTDICFNIIYGDLATKPIEQLATLVDEIFVPLLSNKNNHRKWPKSVAQDISQHVHSLKSTVYQVRGFVAGKTVLPMPIGIDKVHEVAKNMSQGNDAVDLYLKSSIEGVVIKWAIQINDVLLEESSKAFANNQNPTPSSEISFWSSRKENLQYIYDQMREDRVRKMALILEHTDSAYWPCFKNIFFNVVSALTEANEIAVYLKPLEVHFSLIVETDFSDVLPCFIPLMHTVCLVWSKCKYYCTSGRIIVLLKQISNLVIEQAKKYLDPNSIFQTDIDEALMRVQLSLFILKNFRNTFDNYKEKLASFFPEGTTPQLWTFHPNVVFERFNSFSERLQTIELFFLTVVEFIKLERVEIGNVKGSILSSQLIDISQQFTTYFTEFSSKSYDVMNPDDYTFMEDYYAFQANIADLDKRLASILCLAFDDCCNLEGVFKLLEIIGTFLERPLIKQEFNCKFDKIIFMVEKETRIVEQIFNEQMNKHKRIGMIDVELCMPPVAGSLRWIDTLRERLNYCTVKFKALDHPISKGKRASELYRRYDILIDKFNNFQESEFSKWAEKVDETVKTYLNQNIIRRNLPKTMLAVNFHPQLEAILKEVHYFQLDAKEGIPQAGIDIYAKREEFREYTVQLEIIIKWYNKMRRDSRLVEFELVQDKIEKIDILIRKAENDLTWLSTELTEYIGKLHELVRGVQEPLSCTQTNVNTMKTLMEKWLKSPLYMRIEKEGLLSIEDKEERILKRYSEMSEVGIEIHNLLIENKRLFSMEEKGETESWKMYVDYIDNIVRSSLLSTIGCSLSYLTENMDKDTTRCPLLGVKLTLSDANMALTCEPPLDTSQADCFTNIVEDIIKDIMHMSTLIKRVKEEAGTDYKSDIETEEDIVEMIQEIVLHVNTTVEEVMEHCTSFEMYSNIWLDDRQSYMQSFLAYGRQLTMEELELNLMPEETSPPTMELFKQQIDSFEVLYSEIEKLKSTEIFDKWFQLDISPFKMSLLNAVSKWAMMFKEYLLEHVTNSLWELSQFIQDADDGLNQPVQEGDYTALVSVMGYLLKVKERQPETDEMFGPLQETIELLKTYEMELPQDANVLLQELPEQWNSTKKLASNVKQTVSPLQAAEVVSIRRKITWFDMRQGRMREQFKKSEFLRNNIDVVIGNNTHKASQITNNGIFTKWMCSSLQNGLTNLYRVFCKMISEFLGWL